MASIHTIETALKNEFPDPVALGILRRAKEEGLQVDDVRRVNVFRIKGDLDSDTLAKIASSLLSDPITETWSVNTPLLNESSGHVIEITYNPGVMDPVEQSARKALKEIGIVGVQGIKTGSKYLFIGNPALSDLEIFALRNLYNRVIQHRVVKDEDAFTQPSPYKFELKTIKLSGLNDEQLIEISAKGLLSLNIAEMKAVQEYFNKIEKREPTDVELETIAQTWSEHCYHKTFRSTYNFNGKIIPNLLKSTIMRATRELDLPWCVSVFKDNAGVIEFDDSFDICFKVETHNHPSALEPYGGAGTGIGGVIRDILGTGLGAKPVANTDIFCFAPPDTPQDTLPAGVLHPRRIMEGVVAGVRDYGNRMGIPTVNGAVCFHPDYIGNPLVYCGTIGLLPRGMHKKAARPGDFIVVIGGRTGRDGIHGATFSSIELDQQSEHTSSGAVQIGNPIEEKRLMDAMLIARDRGLYTAVTDCGAGGFSSAVGEMGSEIGAKVFLERAPLKYEGLEPWEIWISEAQERMVLAVPPECWHEFKTLMDHWDVECTNLGEFTDTRRLELYYQDNKVADISMEFLHEGIPPGTREAVFIPKTGTDPDLGALISKFSPEELLKKVLSHLDVCSKEWIIRQYDHEVQGGSIIKPLTGLHNDGPSDAAVLRPVLLSNKGCVIACGINVRYGAIDPRKMAIAVIDEALRNIVAVGGDPGRTAILDNFSWGSSTDPEQLGKLVLASEGCYEASKAFGTPFISGKDSLNNEYRTDERLVRIPSTLLISAISVVDDVNRLVTMDAKSAGDFLFLVGLTSAHLGGSVLLDCFGEIGASVPETDLTIAARTFKLVHEAIQSGLVAACHDLSDGGLGVALAEMCFSGGLGCEIDLNKVITEASLENKTDRNVSGSGDIDAVILYSESLSRFLVEVSPANKSEFINLMNGIPVSEIGVLTNTGRLIVHGRKSRHYIDESISELKEAWQSPLRLG